MSLLFLQTVKPPLTPATPATQDICLTPMAVGTDSTLTPGKDFKFFKIFQKRVSPFWNIYDPEMGESYSFWGRILKLGP